MFTPLENNLDVRKIATVATFAIVNSTRHESF